VNLRSTEIEKIVGQPMFIFTEFLFQVNIGASLNSLDTSLSNAERVQEFSRNSILLRQV